MGEGRCRGRLGDDGDSPVCGTLFAHRLLGIAAVGRCCWVSPGEREEECGSASVLTVWEVLRWAVG